MKFGSQWLLNSMWMDKSYFSLHGNVNKQNSNIFATSNPCNYLNKYLHYPHAIAWCGISYYESFLFLKSLALHPARKICTVTSDHYLMLLPDHVVSALQERNALFVVTFT